MAGVSLYRWQAAALEEMHNGCILCGGVGSGKSRTALAYYYILNGGVPGGESYSYMSERPKDLYIITTARKRDTRDWEAEMQPFMLTTDRETSCYDHKVTVDSWNNVAKYRNVSGAFFIFDEQRVVGSGKWSKSFIQIARHNGWILLSATPGDCWMDYVPVFIANGYYRNRSEFNDEHVNWMKCGTFWKPDTRHFRNEYRLIRQRDELLVDMDFSRATVAHHEDVFTKYDTVKYRNMMKYRQDENGVPFENAGGLCLALRKLCSSDSDRQIRLLELLERHPKAIIFYCFDCELELLRNLGYSEGTEIAEWNGHKHESVPTGDKWVYLVQYTAGAEGWNCITTDTVIFFSQQYSWKIQAQSCGRIDRLNTPYTDLYYYHMLTKSPIDMGIRMALNKKKNFTESGFIKW